MVIAFTIVAVVVWLLDLQLPMQSMYIANTVVSTNQLATACLGWPYFNVPLEIHIRQN